MTRCKGWWRACTGRPTSSGLGAPPVLVGIHRRRASFLQGFLPDFYRGSCLLAPGCPCRLLVVPPASQLQTYAGLISLAGWLAGWLAFSHSSVSCLFFLLSSPGLKPTVAAKASNQHLDLSSLLSLAALPKFVREEARALADMATGSIPGSPSQPSSCDSQLIAALSSIRRASFSKDQIPFPAQDEAQQHHICETKLRHNGKRLSERLSHSRCSVLSMCTVSPRLARVWSAL